MTDRLVRVWAPRPSRVELDVGARVEPMRALDGGWWESVVPLAPGTTYAFRLDGGAPLPDPRSHRQPSGVHGPSQLVDHDAFRWTDAQWPGAHLPSAVFYELHTGTFTPSGTFDGVIERLDHLVDLGVTVIELMPVASFPGVRGWGYDGVALYAPHEAYGGPDGLKRLVDAAHARGLGVLLDAVYNHLGPEGNYLDRFAPYFTDHHHTPWGAGVNLDDAGSAEVRRFLIDNARHWLVNYHVDGLRLDAVDTLQDESAGHFLEELAAEVEQLGAHLGRSLSLVAESANNSPRLVLPREAGGYGLAAQWADELHHALHHVLTGESQGYYVDFSGTADVARALRDVFVLAGDWSAHRQRRHGRPAGGVDRHRFVVCTQNHDQVGNRARGERLVHLAGVDAVKVAAGLVLLSPSLPLLFMGEEWAASTPFPFFADYQDEHLADLVRRGRREEFAGFGWDPAEIPDPIDPATFASAVLRWEERAGGVHAEMLAWYRDLLALRREWPDLTDGRVTHLHVDHGATWVRMRRHRVQVVATLTAEAVRLRTHGGDCLLLASGDGVHLDGGDVVLPGYRVAVLALHAS
jgi:maltooligosyltrehalose trehalohydrolase